MSPCSLRRALASPAITFAAVSMAACVTYTLENAIEVKGTLSSEEKVRWAQAFVTEQRLAKLRDQLRATLPTVTDAQLAGLGLRWNQTTFQSLTGQGARSIVTITIAVQYDRGVDPKPIMDAATAILEPEINPPLASPGA